MDEAGEELDASGLTVSPELTRGSCLVLRNTNVGMSERKVVSNS